MIGTHVVQKALKQQEPTTPLKRTMRTDSRRDQTLPKIISLFSGAGGLDLGFQQANFPLSFAADISTAAVQTHRRNFRKTLAVVADLTQLGPDGVLSYLEPLLSDGERIGVIGGPPCQGFSRGNTQSTTEDPRNQLPLLYLQIVEALQEKYTVEFVLFENVLGIRDSKHLATFHGILEKFSDIGLTANAEVYSALDYGIPQKRNRVIITGFRLKSVAQAFKPQKIQSNKLTVRTAIEGLPDPAYFARNLERSSIPFHENHWTMRPVSKRFQHPESAAPSGRSFRRLQWDEPSPTVAYGHREIHVHPSGRRRLSIFEAMLLQGFPRKFVLEGNLSAQVEQVSNAVPPPLAHSLASAIAKALTASDEV
mgnify:FL=1|jgi:DNA (cytosine-5-)-methyltransferase